MDLPLLGPQGGAYSLPLNAQRTVNLFPVLDPAGKHKPALFGTPGCVSWATVGAGPIRGALEFDGVGYVVSGAKLYTVTTSGTVTERGTLPTLVGAVSLATNGLQVLIADEECSVACLDNYGILKPGDGNFYVYDIAAATFAPLVPPDVPSEQSFYLTDLADFTTVDALAFASSESSPDDLVRVFGNQGELWLFGKDSTEIWRDDAGDFPFVRVSQNGRGIAAQNAVAAFDNSLLWLTTERQVMRANGYTPARASDDAVELSIGRMTTVDDAVAFTYTQEGHEFFALIFPTEGVTWVLDAASGLWHERSSNGGAWRARAYLKLGNRHLIGDAASGKLLEIRTDLYDEDGDELVAQHVMPAIWSDQDPISHDRFQLDFEAGVGLVDGSDPHIWLEWSDDQGGSWSNRLDRSLGKMGERKTRAVWTRLGQSVSRNYRFTISAAVKRVIISASGSGSSGRK